MSQTTICSKILNVVLIASLLAPAPLFAQQPAQTPVRRDPFLDALVTDRIDQVPPPRLDLNEANLFKLLTQELDSGSGKTMNLSTTVIELPRYRFESTDAAVTFSIENGAVVLTGKRDGHRHIINGMNAVQIVNGKYDVYILSGDGRISALSKQLIEELAFSSPIPVFEIGKIDSTPDCRLNLVGAETRFTKVSDTVREGLSKQRTRAAVFDGDLAVVSGDGELRTVFDAEFLAQKVLTDSIVLALIVTIQNPEFFKDESWIKKILADHDTDLNEISRIIEKPEVTAAMASSEYRDRLGRLPKTSIQPAVAQLKALKYKITAGPVREQRIIDDILITLEAHREAIENGDAAINSAGPDLEKVGAASKRIDRRIVSAMGDFGSKLTKSLTASNVRKASFALAAVAGLVAADYATDHAASAWFAAYTAKIWPVLIPPVLMSDKWRWPTIRSAVLVMASVPILALLGKIASPFTGLDMKQTLMSARLKTFGVLQGSLYLLTRAINQRTIFPAAKAGVNPFSSPDIYNLPWDRSKAVANRQNTLGEQIAFERNRRALAWLIANQSLMKSENLDPLSLIAAQIELAKAPGDRPMTDADWAGLATELREAFEELSQHPVSITKVDSDYLAQMLERAAEFKARAKENPWALKEARRLSERLKGIWNSSVPRGFSGLGYDTYRRIMTATPTDETARHMFRTFSITYAFGVLFTAFFGARSNLAKPQDLMANPYGKDAHPVAMFEDKNAMLGVNPSFLTETTSEFARWNTARAAGIWMTYDEAGEETHTDSTAGRKATMLETAKLYFSAWGNIRRAEPGTYLWRNFATSLETALAGAIIGVGLRVWLMDQPIAEAFGAHFWSMAMSVWTVSWVGILTNRVMIMTDKQVKSGYRFMVDIENRLEQALERRDLEGVKENFNMLIALRKRAGEKDGEISAADENQIREILERNRARPPIPARMNEVFMTTITLLGAVGIAYMSNAFRVAAFSTTTTGWTEKMIDGWIFSLKMYGAVYGGQKAFNYVWDKIQDRLAKNRPKPAPPVPVALDSRQPAPMCRALFAM